MRPIIVVEGKSDANRLKAFIDAYFITTNGSEVSRETISYIKELSTFKDIYVLTDPDYPGQKIRSIIEKEVPNVINLYVRKEHAIKGKKLGVCECDDEEIKRALSLIKETKEEDKIGTLITSDLLDLDLINGKDAKKRRMFLMIRYPLGYCNGKTLLKRLNSLNISKDVLKKTLEEYHDC